MAMRLSALVLILLGSVSLAQLRRPSLPRGDSFVNQRFHEGEELAVDFPVHEFMENIGSYLDGAGMCVFTSVEMGARWAGLEQMRGFRDWCAKKYPGGGTPSKLDRLIKAYCEAKGVPVPGYIQYEGPNPEQFLELCDRTGRLTAITYGYSPRYGSTIYHMTNCPKFSGKWGVCMDNNLIGGNTREKLYEWMPRATLVDRIKHPGGQAWLFVWLAPGPSPVPFN